MKDLSSITNARLLSIAEKLPKKIEAIEKEVEAIQEAQPEDNGTKDLIRELIDTIKELKLASDVTVKPKITMPQPYISVPVPTVNVQAPSVTVTPDITVQPAQVVMQDRPRKWGFTVHRDEFGGISKITAEAEDK